MILSFELSMPGVASWNGKWSGEGRKYIRVRNFGRGKRSDQRAQKLIDDGYFHYSWPDGWAAGVTVKQVDVPVARRLRKTTNGFCGYDWMIDSIILHGEIKS